MIEIYHSTLKRPLELQSSVQKGSWIHVVDPTLEELEQLAKTYRLEPDLLHDATDIYETPRVEREEQAAYIFTRYCFSGTKDLATEPLLIIYSQENVITIMRTSSHLLDQLLTKPNVVTTQRTKLLLQILGAVNYSYVRDTHQMSKQILSVRSKLSKSDIKNHSFVEFIDLEERLNEYLTSLQSQAVVFRNLLHGKFLPLYEDDKDLVEDLSLETTELIELINSRLKTIGNIREAYATIMANNLNATFRRLTSISIFLTIPAITAALYGMNLKLPLAGNPNAFWFILLIVMGMTTVTIWVFRKLRWL